MSTGRRIQDGELAGRLVTEAGLLAARMLRDGLQVATKTSNTDLVSDADRAAEHLIVARLAADRPEDGVLGEEGATRPGRRTWVIDPVDGTYNFVSGLPLWCSALALVDGEDVLVGAVYQPATGELWVGGPATGTTLGEQVLPPLADRPLAELSVATYLNPTRLGDATLREPLLRAMSGAASARMIGSGSVELAAVAAGRLGVYLHADTLPWDWYPGAALVLGAGGAAEVAEIGGHRWHVAGPPTAVAQAIRALATASGPAR